MPETLYRAIGANTGSKVHVERDCQALRRAERVEETRPAYHPDPDYCALCAGDGGGNGGGSRELYERAKQIGEQRAEATNDD